MTRIDVAIAGPANDKPADKTIKTDAKDGDSRHAAFRSLLKQLGGHDKTAGEALDKDAKMSPVDIVKRGLPATRNRVESKDDRKEAAPEGTSVSPAAEPQADREPVLTWQAILGNGVAEHQAESAMSASLSATSPVSDDGDTPLPSSEKAAHSAKNLLVRAQNIAMPTTADLDITRADTPRLSNTDASDPFAALSSFLDRATGSATEPDAEPAPIKMSVVTRETHFEPVARLSPVQQIATTVGEELATVVQSAPTETASQTTEPSRHSSGPLKVLHLKLEPENLGSVVLKMRLVDKSLELEVVASRQETADLLAKDRDTLTRVLRGSGYTADVIAISASTSTDNGQMAGDNRAGAQASSGQSGAQAGGDRGAGDQANSGGKTPTRSQPMEGGSHEESGTGSPGGDLYL